MAKEERIGFNDKKARKQFFEAVKKYSGASGWRELWHFLGVGKTFQNYLYGSTLIPKSLFEKMLLILPKTGAEMFRQCTFSMPANWGEVKGGKALFAKYPDEIKRRMQNGLKKLNSLGYGVEFDIKPLQPISEVLCEFIGAFMGDGYLDGAKTVGFAGHTTLDKEYFGHLNLIAKGLFGIRGSVIKVQSKNGSHLKFYSKGLVRMLQNRFGFTYNKTHTVEIPLEILNSEERYIFPLVRGVFDTDGCVYFDRRKSYKTAYPRIALSMTSQKLIRQIANILAPHFAIFHTSRKRQGKNKATEYIIEIYGHLQLEKWMKMIGFSNAKHLDKIRKAAGGI